MTARSAAQIDLLRADRTHNAYALCAPPEVGEQPLPFFTLTLFRHGLMACSSISQSV